MMSRARAARRCAGSASCSRRARSISNLSVMQNLVYHAALHGIGPVEATRRGAGGAGARRPRRSRQRQGARSLRRTDAPRRDRRARCCTSRACCCSTSRPSASTSRRAPIFSPMCARWSREREPRRAVDDASHRRGGADDDVVVLHQGKVLARRHGRADDRRRAAARRPSAPPSSALTGAIGTETPRHERTSLTTETASPLRQYAICLAGIVWREALRFLHQRERFVSALVRPLVWLLHLRGGLSPGARRLDHPALRDLCAL